MKIFPSSSIKKLDAYTIEHEPIASIDLMERAAQALTKAITNRWNPETPVTIFAGPGNNGGDGVAAAHQLLERGMEVRAVLVGRRGISLQHERRTFARLPDQQRTGRDDGRSNFP